MYSCVLFRNDGKINIPLLNDYVMVGNSGINTFKIYVEGRLPANYSATVSFKRADEVEISRMTTSSIFKHPITNQDVSGFSFTLTNEINESDPTDYTNFITLVQGDLVISINLYTSGVLLNTYQFTISVNPAIANSTLLNSITYGELQSFLVALSSKLWNNDNKLIRHFDTLALANADLVANYNDMLVGQLYEFKNSAGDMVKYIVYDNAGTKALKQVYNVGEVVDLGYCSDWGDDILGMLEIRHLYTGIWNVADYEPFINGVSFYCYLNENNTIVVLTNGKTYVLALELDINILSQTATTANVDAVIASLASHTSNVSNPHSVTKAQVGLGNVDNTSDLNKPISTATQTALNLKADKSDTYTKTEVDNKLATVYKYKGTLADMAALNALTGMEVGDLYNVVDAGTLGTNVNFAWTGSAWDNIGGVEALATASNNGMLSKEDFVKLSALYTKAQLDTLLLAKADKTTTINGHALSANFDITKADIGLGNLANPPAAQSIYGGTLITNLDTIAFSGFYTAYAGATGNPFSNSTHILHTNSSVGTGGDYQIAVDVSTGAKKERLKVSSVWSSWLTVYSSTEVDALLLAKDNNIYGTNIALNGDFSSSANWTASYGTISIASNKATITGDGTSQFLNLVGGEVTLSTLANHKLYVKIKITTTDALYSNSQLVIKELTTAGAFIKNTTVISTFSKNASGIYSGIITLSSTTGKIAPYVILTYADSATQSGKTYDAEYCMIMDLTTSYSSGYEPLYAEMVDSILYVKYPTTSYFNGTSILVNNAMLAKMKASLAQPAWQSATLLNGFTGSVNFRLNSLGKMEMKINVTAPATVTSNAVCQITNSGYVPLVTPTFNVYDIAGTTTTVFLRATTHFFSFITNPTANHVYEGYATFPVD